MLMRTGVAVTNFQRPKSKPAFLNARHTSGPNDGLQFLGKQRFDITMQLQALHGKPHGMPGQAGQVSSKLQEKLPPQMDAD